jgi:hypothetical protein
MTKKLKNGHYGESYGGRSCERCHCVNEGYMVQNEIWNQAIQNFGRKNTGLLCVLCVQDLIKRPLESQDFTDYPINKGVFDNFIPINYVNEYNENLKHGIERVVGKKVTTWLKNNKFHKLNSPAVIFDSGRQRWCVSGVIIEVY